ELLAVQLDLCREPAALPAPWITGQAMEGHGQGQVAGDAPQRELAGHVVTVIRTFLNPRAHEADLRMVLGVEEVPAAEMRVAILLACVNARGLDLELHRRPLDMLAIEKHDSAEAREPAPGSAQHVPDAETDFRVIGIDDERLEGGGARRDGRGRGGHWIRHG